MYGSILYFAFAHHDHLRLCQTLLNFRRPTEHEKLTGSMAGNQYFCPILSLDFLRILWHLLLPEVSANDATEATKVYGKSSGPDE